MIVPASAVYGVAPLQHSDIWYKKCSLMMCVQCLDCLFLRPCVPTSVICIHPGCEWHAGFCKYCRNAFLGFGETGSTLCSVFYWNEIIYKIAISLWFAVLKTLRCLFGMCTVVSSFLSLFRHFPSCSFNAH